eukprot:scaffold574_cov246-Pinguiococcus_pyrenoidosus.AAC.22
MPSSGFPYQRPPLPRTCRKGHRLATALLPVEEGIEKYSAAERRMEKKDEGKRMKDQKPIVSP